MSVTNSQVLVLSPTVEEGSFTEDNLSNEHEELMGLNSFRETQGDYLILGMLTSSSILSTARRDTFLIWNKKSRSVFLSGFARRF